MVATTTQPISPYANMSCDLLKNIYLCGSNNNSAKLVEFPSKVVICLKISIFVVATTTQYLMNKWYLLL